MAELNTNIRGEQIRDDSIPEAKLEVYNSPTDGYYLKWNASQSKFEWATVDTATAVQETPTGDINGSNTAYTITSSPVANTLAVYLNGLYQEEGAGNDYTLSGLTITFVEAPETNDILLVQYLTGAGVGGGGGDVSAYRLAFTDGDLSSGVLSVNHALGQQYCSVTVSDNDDEIISPDEVTFTDANNLSIDLSSYGTLSGTWNVVVLG
jgi:hypothetical protein